MGALMKFPLSRSQPASPTGATASTGLRVSFTSDAFERGEPSEATNRPSRSSTITGDIEERGRLPGAAALAAGAPSFSVGEKLKSVSWLLRKKPPTMRPEPKTLSTVVVIETTLPAASTMTKCEVPAASSVASGANATGRDPADGFGAARSVIPAARAAT